MSLITVEERDPMTVFKCDLKAREIQDNILGALRHFGLSET
ncbi:MAG TPA: hypothetical protein VE818_13440 [Nitrososphaeraceae archaeon]|jgi:hypothetical protein|nr:hypothetical protein [Nitrososphaeraceae archaeon]